MVQTGLKPLDKVITGHGRAINFISHRRKCKEVAKYLGGSNLILVCHRNKRNKLKKEHASKRLIYVIKQPMDGTSLELTTLQEEASFQIITREPKNVNQINWNETATYVPRPSSTLKNE